MRKISSSEINICSDRKQFAGSVTAHGAGGASIERRGGAGTVYVMDTSDDSGVLIVDNDGVSASSGSTPLPENGGPHLLVGLLIRNGAGVSSVDPIVVEDNDGVQDNLVISAALSAPALTVLDQTLDGSVLSFDGNIALPNLRSIVRSSVTMPGAGSFSAPNLVRSIDSTLHLDQIVSAVDFEIDGGTVDLTASAGIEVSGDLSVTAATLRSRRIIAADLAVANTALVEGKPVIPDEATSLTISVATLHLDTTSTVSADGLGYKAGITAGFSPFTANVAGSHGGIGARYWAVPNFMPTYGSFAWPDFPGSGSGRNDQYAGPGGGLIVVEAVTVVVDGTISADAAFEHEIQSSPGSGGAIRIIAGSIAGTGTISADGGTGLGSTPFDNGGGGRIAILLDETNDFSGTFQAYGGRNTYGVGGAGTIFIKDASDDRGVLIVDNGGSSGPTEPTDLPSVGSGFSSELTDYNLSDSNRTFVAASLSGLYLNPNLANESDDLSSFFPIVGNDLHSISTDSTFGSLYDAPANAGDHYAGYLVLDRLTVGGGAVLVTEDYIRATSIDASNDGSIDSPDLTAYLSPLDFGTLVPMEDNGRHYAVPVWYALALPEGAKYSLLSQWVVTEPTDKGAVADLQSTTQNPLCCVTTLSLPSWSEQSCDFAFAPDSLMDNLQKIPLPKPILLASLTVPTLEESLSDSANETMATDPEKPVLPSNPDYPQTAPGLDPIYEYDKLDRITRVIDPIGTLTYTYDLQTGALTSIHDSQIDKYTYFSYDSLGRNTRIDYPNGMICTYEYGTDLRLAKIEYAMNGTVVDSFAYSYDEAGNISRIDRPDWSVNYSYDLNNQLISANYEGTTLLPNEHYEYDAVGNRLSSHISSSYVYDELNRLLEDDQYAYEWDDNGNLIAKIDKVTNAATFFHYDPQNKLSSIELPDGKMVSFGYDAEGRRISRTANGVTEKFHYDGDDVLFDTDGSDTITLRYVNIPGTVDQKVYATSLGDGQQYAYLKDHLGTIWKVLDSQGNVVKDYTYDSFGQVKGESGSYQGRYTYTGREFESESGLYYYRFRYYNPMVGQFAEEDVLTSAEDNSQLYIYVKNNPLSQSDPFGTKGFASSIMGFNPPPFTIPIFPSFPFTVPNPFDKNDPLECKLKIKPTFDFPPLDKLLKQEPTVTEVKVTISFSF